MSLNQLLYADSNVDINNRKWLNIKANSLRFGAKGDGFDQQVLDYYTYDPDAPNSLTLDAEDGTISGTMTLDVARIGRMVTIAISSGLLTLTQTDPGTPMSFSAGTISSNARPRFATYFTIPAVIDTNNPDYNKSEGTINGYVDTNGEIYFESCIFQATQIAGDIYYAGTIDGGGFVTGTVEIDNCCISYLHAA